MPQFVPQFYHINCCFVPLLQFDTSCCPTAEHAVVSAFSFTQCCVLRGCTAGSAHTRTGTFNAIVFYSSILSRNFISYTVFLLFMYLCKIGETLIKISGKYHVNENQNI